MQKFSKKKRMRSTNLLKIYSDSTRYLGIDYGNNLYFPITRMDLLFWKNIQELGTSVQTLRKNVKLEQFSKIYNGLSLFQYFANDLEMIQMIHEKYKMAQDQHILTPLEMLMPLTILHPNQSNGRTALDEALNEKQERIFELMIELLIPVIGNLCVTKLMLKSLPQMV